MCLALLSYYAASAIEVCAIYVVLTPVAVLSSGVMAPSSNCIDGSVVWTATASGEPSWRRLSRICAP